MMLGSKHKSLGLSIVFHVLVLFVLIVSFDFKSESPVLENADKDAKVIDAVAMNAVPAPVAPPIKEQPKIEPRKETPLSPPPPKIEPKVAPVKPVAPQPPKPDTIAIQKQQKEKQKKLQEAELAKQLLADLKKQTKQQKKLKQQSLEQAFEKELKEKTAQSLQQQLLQEQQRASSAKMRGVVDKYKALILQAVGRRWLVPSGADQTAYVKLLIRLAPGGEVLDVQVMKNSGNPSLDHSAREAVLKASPLPVPDDADGFDQFRQFVLKMKPENVVASN